MGFFNMNYNIILLLKLPVISVKLFEPEVVIDSKSIKLGSIITKTIKYSCFVNIIHRINHKLVEKI